jgi:hypothetical protein
MFKIEREREREREAQNCFLVNECDVKRPLAGFIQQNMKR